MLSFLKGGFPWPVRSACSSIRPETCLCPSLGRCNTIWYNRPGLPDRGPREPALSQDEFEYLISAIRSVFPEVELKTEDVQVGFSGVRVVLDTGQKNPSKKPRDHAIWDEKGLVTVAGGKLTTFRIIVQEVLRIVWKRFPGLYRKPERCGLIQPEVISLPSELSPKIRVRLIG